MIAGGACPVIHIAAALIEDGAGRLLLVRKTDSRFFIQAGGKIELGETPAAALVRELHEEIGLSVTTVDVQPIGRFSAPAANEAGARVDAHVFRLRTDHQPVPAAEIAEARWVRLDDTDALPLAPLIRDHILPWYRSALAQT